MHERNVACAALVSESFFNKRASKRKAVLTETWAKMIDGFRNEANAAQTKTAEIMAANRVKVTVVDKTILAEARKRMLVTEDELVEELKFAPKLVEKISAVVNASD